MSNFSFMPLHPKIRTFPKHLPASKNAKSNCNHLANCVSLCHLIFATRGDTPLGYSINLVAALWHDVYLRIFPFFVIISLRTCMNRDNLQPSRLSKLIPRLLLGTALLGFTIYGSTKSSRAPSKAPATVETITANATATVAPSAEMTVNYVETLHRYFAPTNFAADLSIFTRPTNAVTPSLWRRHSVSDDFQVTVENYVAGACGVVTTQPWGIDSPETIKDTYQTFAPFYATNSLIVGTSDFWTVTNESSKTFVWKNAAFQRDPSQLVSFALTLYNWGDVEFTYGETIPAGGFSSFMKIGAETVDMTAHVAPARTVRIEKNLTQDTEWWIENYPEICYTNATGELVFDYDTNEWYFVDFYFGYDEAYAAYKRDRDEYFEKYDASLSYEESHRVKYVTADSKIEEDALIELLEKCQRESFPNENPPDLRVEGFVVGASNGKTNWKIVTYNEKFIRKHAGTLPDIEDYIDKKNKSIAIPSLDTELNFYFPKRATLEIHTNGVACFSTLFSGTNTLKHTGAFKIGLVHKIVKPATNYTFTDKNGNCAIWQGPPNSPYRYFTRKLDLKIKGLDFSNKKNYAKAEAELKPKISKGFFSWNTTDNFRIISQRKDYAGITWEDGLDGSVSCVWDNGDPGEWKYSVTNTCNISSVTNFNEYTHYLNLTASPANIAFSSEHLDKNGVLKASGTEDITLVCSYGGTQPGRMELSRDGGGILHSWDVSGPDSRTFKVNGISSPGSETFYLKYTGSSVPDGFEATATVTATSVEVEANRTWPTMRKRRIFGPGEPFTITVDQEEHINKTAPTVPGIYTKDIHVINDIVIPLEYSVIAPTGCIATSARPMTNDDWLELDYSTPLMPGEIGAGLYAELKLVPDYVSFKNVKTVEGECAAQNMQGYYITFDMSQVRHDNANGAWRQVTIDEENGCGFDRAGNAKTTAELPPPWTAGSYEWHIPFYWSADDFATTNRFSTNIQRFQLYPNGDFSVSKFGWTAHRSTNGVHQVTKD